MWARHLLYQCITRYISFNTPLSQISVGFTRLFCFFSLHAFLMWTPGQLKNGLIIARSLMKRKHWEKKKRKAKYHETALLYLHDTRKIFSDHCLFFRLNARSRKKTMTWSLDRLWSLFAATFDFYEQKNVGDE